MEWSFPSNNNGDINGIGHSGIETFQGAPLKSLAREICQNSLDAAVEGKQVEIEFAPFTLKVREFPDADSLKTAFTASIDFWSLQKSKKTTEFFERALKLFETGTISFLRISDFNTTGLSGSKDEYNTPWCNLTKSSGASDKTGTSGGSFGIGKFAPFSCSDFRTVFYSTLDSDNITAFQGISRITSFRCENNDVTVGVGYYGDENNSPVHTQLNLDPNFCRGNKKTGTDIYVAGFKYYSTDWKTDIISSILDGFLYAIFAEKLIVRVGDLVISKETLKSLIDDYQTSFSENADKYYTVLTSDETVWYQIDFKNHGLVRLGLIIRPEMHRKVAMIRKTGMKIMDRGNISGIIPFAGVMLIEGDKVNDFLRSIENPQHTKWEPDRVEPLQVPAARAYVKDLIDYIKDCLDALKKKDDSEEIDPSVGEFLPDESDADIEADKHPVEALNDTIKVVEATVVNKKHNSDSMTGEGNETEIDNEQGSISEDDIDSGAGHENGQNSAGGTGSGSYDGDGKGTNPKEHHKILSGITATKIRSVCLNKDSGEYAITFIPTDSAENGCLEIFLSAETQNYGAPILSAMSFGQPKLSVVGNKISGLILQANTPLRLKVTLDYHDYCSMEVKAYGNKA
jgi:hypothetical protein